MKRTKIQSALLAAIQAAGGAIVIKETKRGNPARTVESLRKGPSRVEGLHYCRTACQIAVWLDPHPGIDLKSVSFEEQIRTGAGLNRWIDKASGETMQPVSLGTALAPQPSHSQLCDAFDAMFGEKVPS